MFISNCCGAKVYYLDTNTMTGICADCHEGCEAEKEEESEFCLGKMD